MQKKSYGHQLHFDSIDSRWDENQFAYRKITLDDLLHCQQKSLSINSLHKQKTALVQKKN